MHCSGTRVVSPLLKVGLDSVCVCGVPKVDEKISRGERSLYQITKFLLEVLLDSSALSSPYLL